MNSPPTSSLRFLDKDGAELTAPAEWASCLVEVALPREDWHRLRLERDDLVLALSVRVLTGERRILADWPASGTGAYELRLTHGDQRQELLGCRIESRKIDAAAYAALLHELESRLPASIVIGLRRMGALAGVTVSEPGQSALGEELVKLRRAVAGTDARPGLAAILKEVARDPHQVPIGGEAWVERKRARRVHPSRLAQVARAGNLDPDGVPLRLPEMRPAESADVYENRLLKTFAEQVELRLGRLETALRRRPSSRTRERLLRECRELEEALRPAARAAHFLAAVESLRHVPDRLSMVLLRRPAYRAALEGLLDLRRRAGARLEEPRLEAPLEQLPHLYETWGALQAIDSLLELGQELGFRVIRQDVVVREPSGVFIRVPIGNRPALELRRESDDTVVRLIPQRHYESDSIPYRSASFRQKPDIAVEVERPGERGSICIFDPKYKLRGEDVGEDGKPKKEDVDTMHAYRDAIRDGEGRRVVRHAAILYPGPSKAFGDGLGAISAVPGATTSLREELRAVLTSALDGEAQATTGD